MDYKTSFAAIMSYALERDLTNCSVAEVINLMKSEYKTDNLQSAFTIQLSLLPNDTRVFGKYAKVIDDALNLLYLEIEEAVHS